MSKKLHFCMPLPCTVHCTVFYFCKCLEIIISIEVVARRTNNFANSENYKKVCQIPEYGMYFGTELA